MRARPRAPTIEDALSGNLCRCTGYRPIVDAAQAMYDAAARGTGAGWRGRGTGDGGRVLSADEERLAAELGVARAHGHLRLRSAAARRWWAPRSLDALAALRVEHPDGADRRGRHRRRPVGHQAPAPPGRHRLRGRRGRAHRDPPHRRRPRDRRGRDARRCVRRAGRRLARTARSVGALRVGADPQQRHARRQRRQRLAHRRFDAGADGARAPRWCCATAAVTRTLPLEEFYLDYQKTALQPGEFVAGVRVPARAGGPARARLQDQQALRPGHLRRVRLLRARRCRGRRSLPTRASAAAASRPRRGAPPPPKRHSRASRWDDATAEAAARVLAASSRRSPTCARPPRTAAPCSPTCCAASGSRPAARACPRGSSRSSRRRRAPAERALHPTAMNAPHPPSPALADAAASAVVGAAVAHDSAALHVAGTAQYTDDLPEPRDTLHVAVGVSPIAHGTLRGLDLAAVRAAPGVVAVITAADIPGVNDVGPIVHDDPIFADRHGRVRRAAGVRRRGHERATRPAAPRGSRRSTSSPLPATPHDRRRVGGRVVRAAARARDPRRRGGRAGARAASAARQGRRRRAGSLLSRRPDRARDSARARRHADLHVHAASGRSAAHGRARARGRRARRRRRVPADGRRLRRQGNADVALRLRGGDRRAQDRPRRQGAPRSRRRHALHRQAARVPVRVRRRLRRSRAASSAWTSRSRRAAASPPTCPAR